MKNNLEDEKFKKTANVLKAIAHPLRLKVLKILKGKKTICVAEIMEVIEVEQSLLSHHLAKMRNLGIIESKRKGRQIYYSLVRKDIIKLFDCIEGSVLL